MADTSMEFVFGMPFLTLSNANVIFAETELTWRLYTAVEALSPTKRVQIIDQKEFTMATLDLKEVFIVHVAAPISIHLVRKA